MNIRYVPSKKRKVQGKESEIRKKYGKEWEISPLGEGNGNWLLSKKSDVLLDEKSCRKFVLDYYHEDKLRKGLAEQFRQDLKNGNIEMSQVL